MAQFLFFRASETPPPQLLDREAECNVCPRELGSVSLLKHILVNKCVLERSKCAHQVCCYTWVKLHFKSSSKKCLADLLNPSNELSSKISAYIDSTLWVFSPRRHYLHMPERIPSFDSLWVLVTWAPIVTIEQTSLCTQPVFLCLAGGYNGPIVTVACWVVAGRVD